MRVSTGRGARPLRPMEWRNPRAAAPSTVDGAVWGRRVLPWDTKEFVSSSTQPWTVSASAGRSWMALAMWKKCCRPARPAQ